MESRTIALLLTGILGLMSGVLISFVRSNVSIRFYVFIPLVPFYLSILSTKLAFSLSYKRSSSLFEFLSNLAFLLRCSIIGFPTFVGMLARELSTCKETETTNEIVFSKINAEYELALAC